MLIQIVANSHNKVKFYVIAAGFEKKVVMCHVGFSSFFSRFKKEKKKAEHKKKIVIYVIINLLAMFFRS